MNVQKVFISSLLEKKLLNIDIDFVQGENNMFTKWSLLDDDCAQYMRNDGTLYEMIQYIWLDTTEEDRANGTHEYVICKTEVDVLDLSDDDVLCAIRSYGYTIVSLLQEYGDAAMDMIAECYMEEELFRDCNILCDADSKEEAEQKVLKYVRGVWKFEDINGSI